MASVSFTDRPHRNLFLKKTGAGNGVRTRDPELGKLVLYQLSYTRIARILPIFAIADKLKIYLLG
jgi:hypothetical protein